MAFEKVTETQSYYDNLQDMSETELLVGINNEDKKVAYAVEKAIPQTARLVEHIVPNMKRGGRIFYLGAGTSGRLGVLDASEIPPNLRHAGDKRSRFDSRRRRSSAPFTRRG